MVADFRYVAFVPGKPQLPWVRRDYAHCIGFSFSQGMWQFVELEYGRVSVRTVPTEVADRWLEVLAGRTTEIVRLSGPRERPWLYMPMTCVHLTAAFVGVRTLGVLSPWRFRCLLRRKGAEVMDWR